MSTLTIPKGIFFLLTEEREKADTRPFDGAYREFAKEVRRLLGFYPEDGRHYLTSRMASRKTGVNHATVTTMIRGDRASYQTILKFAAGLDGDANKLLRLAGYEAVSTESDPLSRIGSRVDISALASTPLSPLRASAGNSTYPGSTGIETEMLGSELPSGTRSIRVDGDCMEPLYRNGDILLVREAGAAENGDEVIALLDDDSLACKVYRANGEAYLQPTNGEGRILAHRFRVVGVVEGLVRIKR